MIFSNSLVSHQLSTDASCLPFAAPAALQLFSHSTTMLIKLRFAGTANCGTILHHLILEVTLMGVKLIWLWVSNNISLVQFLAMRAGKCGPSSDNGFTDDVCALTAFFSMPAVYFE
jgi:energy-converting hydrogenase Eha subunit E